MYASPYVCVPSGERMDGWMNPSSDDFLSTCALLRDLQDVCVTATQHSRPSIIEHRAAAVHRADDDDHVDVDADARGSRAA